MRRRSDAKEGWPETAVCREIINAIDERWIAGKPWCYARNSDRSAVKNIMTLWNLERGLVEMMLLRWSANKVIEEDVCDTKNHVKGYRKIASCFVV